MQNIEDLRTHLFQTLVSLKDKNNPMDVDRAKAVAGVAQVIVDSARLEIEMARITGDRGGSGFLPLLRAQQDKPGTPEQPRLVKGLLGK